MAEDERLIEAYAAIVFGGAGFEDGRLALLRALMTPGEVSRVKELLLAEYVRTLPPLPGNGAGAPEGPEGVGSDAPVGDFAGLYVALVRRGARPDDPRLAMLADGMTGEELGRAKGALGELWLRGEALPARPH